jgi:PAS domain S-box-containing protein
VYPQHSAVVLPLSFESETYGVLGIAIPQTFRNDPEVQDLLREISQDLGFAFYKIKMRKALQVVEERYRLLTENIPGVVYLCYPEVPWVMLYLNERIQDLTGYPREEFLAGRITYASLCHPEDLPEMERAIAEALRTRTTFHLRYRLRHRNGMYFWVEEWGTGIFEGEKAVYLEGFIQDVTERKLAEERIQYLATHDQLTGFYNRIFLRDFLREPPLPFPLGLLLCDVNGLRLVNEAFGEKTGDQLLQHFAEVLRLSCPPIFFASVGMSFWRFYLPLPKKPSREQPPPCANRRKKRMLPLRPSASL